MQVTINEKNGWGFNGEMGCIDLNAILELNGEQSGRTGRRSKPRKLSVGVKCMGKRVRSRKKKYKKGGGGDAGPHNGERKGKEAGTKRKSAGGITNCKSNHPTHNGLQGEGAKHGEGKL